MKWEVMIDARGTVNGALVARGDVVRSSVARQAWFEDAEDRQRV